MVSGGANSELTTAEKIRRLPWSLAANAANAVFVYLTFFGPVFVLFLDELGLDKPEVGLVLSVIQFAGLLAMAVAPAAERFGHKRTFLTFFGIRKIVALSLLATPWVLSQFGRSTLVWFVLTIVTAFSVCRAIAITARFPWVQEFVPDAMRGKYSAMGQVLNGFVGFVAVAAASAYLGDDPSLLQFTLLFGVGSMAGLVALWANSFVPGGEPVGRDGPQRSRLPGLLEAAGDTNLVRYLLAVGLVTLSTTGLASFVPLYMREEVGLSSGNIVLLQGATMVGGLVTSFVWGWTADRYGSKPVALSGAFLKVLLPVFWFVMPRGSSWSLTAALLIALWQGFVDVGWLIGARRLLFVSVVPADRSAAYMAVYFAWISLVSGLSQLAGGQLLDAASSLSGNWLIFTVDPYTVLFAVGFVLPLLGSVSLRGVCAADAVSVSEFAGLFFQGNPVLAMEALITYQLAKDEASAVSVTEQLGRSDSPLTVEELLESLSDPRFNVRFEAVVSIAQRSSEPRLMEGLEDVLSSPDPALSVMAAWGLGRIGDKHAVEALREGLNAQYRSVRAHSARSLGTLGDRASAPLLLERLRAESDSGLKVAYAAALGSLRYEPAGQHLLELALRWESAQERQEFALALARVLGGEQPFVGLLRERRGDVSTALSQAVVAVRKKLGPVSDGVLVNLDECARAMARGSLEEGAAMLSRVIHSLLMIRQDGLATSVLRACAAELEQRGVDRFEFLALALHVLKTDD